MTDEQGQGKQTALRADAWRYPASALLTLAIVSPAILAGRQWATFAQLNGLGTRGVVIPLVYFAATEWLLAFGTIAAGLLIWRGWWKSAWVVFLVWIFVVYTAAEADRQTYVRTNVHLRDYASLLRTPGAKQWAGNLEITRYLWSLIADEACNLVALPLIAGVIVAWGLRRYASPRAARRVVVGLVATLAIALVGVVPAQWSDGDRPTLARAHASLPFDFRWSAPGVAFVDTTAFAATLDKRLLADHRRVARIQPTTTPAQVPPTDAASPADAHRDVLLIIAESLRADSLSPDVMPRLCALASGGTTLAAHASGAKYTQFAIYNLLTSRPAFRFASDGRCGAPVSAAMFRRLGYAAQYLGSSDFHWRGLDQFIDARTFDRIRNFPVADWSLADHLTVKAAHDDLTTPAATPRFTVVYLISTHFPYAFPDRFATRSPQVSSQRSLIMMDEATDRVGLINRYHNACGFLDDEIAALVNSVDLSRTVVAITGDHGESFWDDRSLTHGGRWSEVATHVPCVLLGAGVAPGVRCDRPTCHQDVIPTLLDLATGRHVPVAGSIGHDVLEATSSPDGVQLLCSESSDQYGQALIARGGRRLLVEFSHDRRTPIVLGSVDRLGNVDPYDAPPPGDAVAWADAIDRLLQPLD